MNSGFPTSIAAGSGGSYNLVCEARALLGIVPRSLSISGRMVVPRRRRSELSDEELVSLCQENDHDAFTELVDRYKNGIHWLVRRMVGSSEHEDLTQEVFLRAYRAIPSFRGESSFKTWIFRIGRNLCLSELRKAGRRGEHVSLDEEGEEKIRNLLPESGSDVETLLERRELSRCVKELVDELPVQYRTVLTLFYVNRIRYEDIAEIMDIPLGTVKTHLYRARMRLRNLVLDSSKVAGLARIDGGPASADEVKP